MSISYKDAGVNIKTGAEFIADIKDTTSKTHNRRVLNALGSFASMYDISGFEQPILVSGTDGVGTKIMLAIKHNDFVGIGQDCVAMCVNDILCHGAQPLFFLDYLACGSLNKEVGAEIVRGISQACVDTGCALVGGETAEMPDMYKSGDYDIAGFVVGIVDKRCVINGSDIHDGDVLIGCASSGLHSNGYSLVRALFTDTDMEFQGSPLYKTLLTPTRLYVQSISRVLKKYNESVILGKSTVDSHNSLPKEGKSSDAKEHNEKAVKGLAHITGGGLLENVPRILPQGLTAVVDTKKIPPQKIFEMIRATGQVEERELWSTFNMGVGMVLVVQREHAKLILDSLQAEGEQAFEMGVIQSSVNDTQAMIKADGICLI